MAPEALGAAWGAGGGFFRVGRNTPGGRALGGPDDKLRALRRSRAKGGQRLRRGKRRNALRLLRPTLDEALRRVHCRAQRGSSRPAGLAAPPRQPSRMARIASAERFEPPPVNTSDCWKRSMSRGFPPRSALPSTW